MNITTIRSNLATRLSAVDGLRAHQVAPGQITAPAAVVYYGSPFLVRDSNTTWSVEFIVRLLVAAALTDTAQDNLDALLPDVIAKLEADPDITVVTVDEPGAAAYGQVTYLAVDMTVRVMALDED
jgi:hypothetical protein